MTEAQDEYQKRLRLFREHIAAVGKSAETLEDIRGRLLKKYPFKEKEVEALDPETGFIVYAMFKKFEQLVVLMNDNVFKNIPYFEMENTAKMFRFDFVVYAEKVGIVKSAKSFVDAVALRNQLAHEYPLDVAKQTKLINNVIVESEVLLEAVPALRSFVESRLPEWKEVRKNEKIMTAVIERHLVLPDIIYKASYIEALREGFYRGNQPVKTEAEIEEIERDFPAHLKETHDPDGLVQLPSGEWVKKVPGHEYWLVEGDKFIGETSIRYELSDFLRQFGGHVGYGIRPSRQRKGFGKLILKLSLDILKGRGVEKVFITCDDENIGSYKIIEANAGVLENKIPSVFDANRLMRRYWIDLGG